MKHTRAKSFADVDEVAASGVLSDLLIDNKVLLGGSSMGKGLSHAARYHLNRVSSVPELGQEDDLFEPDYLQVPEDAFYVVDLGVVVSQVYQWRRYFPRVQCFYAVKANPDPVIVQTLAILGCNFDCASRNEIHLVQEQSKGLSRNPEIIYANPCKGRAHSTSFMPCFLSMISTSVLIPVLV